MKTVPCPFALALAFAALAHAVQSAEPPTSSDQPPRPQQQEWGTVISLDGEWDIAEAKPGATTPPVAFPGKVPVPGLISSARPAFADVGVQSPSRDSFWYRRNIRLPGAVPALARLKIGKAMYGTQVFVNGREAGESAFNFTPLYFEIARFLRGDGAENEILIRVGAHISNVPTTVTSGGDPERHRYPPGIYDRVELILSGDPYVARVQIAPRLESRSVEVAIDVASSRSTDPLKLDVTVRDWQTGTQVAAGVIESGALLAGREHPAVLNLALSECQPWNPSSPHLYVLELTDGRDRYRTRFGMRSFAVEPGATNRAWLNGERCFIRGTNFAIHRFFEDPACGQRPWDPAWVRALFRRFTAMDMNGARFCIGAAPELWYEIADEEGLMIFDEFALWYAYQPELGDMTAYRADPYKRWGIWPAELTTDDLVAEYTAWMQERWNHPAVIVWDAQNETWAKQTGEAIARVRGLDRSNRPWDNGWSPPAQPTDIREAHTYFEGWVPGTEMATDRTQAAKPFGLAALANAERVPSTFYLPFQYHYGQKPDWHWNQPCVLNEYSYLWLHRDGSPTELTRPYYDAVLGPKATADERRELYARYLAAVTEYWRATRSCFGVLYPFGLAGSIPGGATSDSFSEVESLRFDPAFERFVTDAFSALGICAELWQTEFHIEPWRGTQAEFPVAIINDTGQSRADEFEVAVISEGSTVSSQRFRYTMHPYAVDRTFIKLDLPRRAGRYELVASLRRPDGRSVRSYRPIVMHPPSSR